VGVPTRPTGVATRVLPGYAVPVKLIDVTEADATLAKETIENIDTSSPAKKDLANREIDTADLSKVLLAYLPKKVRLLSQFVGIK